MIQILRSAQANETADLASQSAKEAKDRASQKANEVSSEAQKQAQPAIDQAKETYNQASSQAQSAKDAAAEKAGELQKAAKDKSQPVLDEATRLKDQASQKAQVHTRVLPISRFSILMNEACSKQLQAMWPSLSYDILPYYCSRYGSPSTMIPGLDVSTQLPPILPMKTPWSLWSSLDSLFIKLPKMCHTMSSEVKACNRKYQRGLKSKRSPQ